MIDDYFDSLEKDGKPVVKPTVTGLALHLDLTRQGLIEYEAKPDFSYTVKIGKARVEKFIEERLYEGSPAGAIFNLKNNFGWKDERHLDQTINPGKEFLDAIAPTFGPLAERKKESEE